MVARCTWCDVCRESHFTDEVCPATMRRSRLTSVSSGECCGREMVDCHDSWGTHILVCLECDGVVELRPLGELVRRHGTNSPGPM